MSRGAVPVEGGRFAGSLDQNDQNTIDRPLLDPALLLSASAADNVERWLEGPGRRTPP